MRAITGISVLALVLSGCADRAAPATLETPDLDPPPPVADWGPTASPAPSPSQDAELPDVAAVAALEAYFASANQLARGGDPERHKRYYSDSCVACVSAAQDFTSALASGLRADRDRYAAWRISVEDSESGSALLTSEIDFAPVNLLDEEGVAVEEIPAWSGAVFAWTLAKQPDGTWTIVHGQLLT